ncbi:MAG: hypothetical protein QM703_22890 [Gemmatales bacterium]
MNNYITAYYSKCRQVGLIHFYGKAKIPYQARLLYSVMVSHKRFREEGISRYTLASLTSMNRSRSVPHWLKWLYEHKLIEEVTVNSYTRENGKRYAQKLYRPIKPADDLAVFDKREKVYNRKNYKGEYEAVELGWWEKLGKNRLLLKAAKSPLTLIQTGVYCLVAHQSDRKIRLSIKRIARLLGISLPTARSAVHKLHKVGLIDKWLNPLEPDEAKTKWFQTKPERKQLEREKEYVIESITRQEKKQKEAGIMSIEEVKHYQEKAESCLTSDEMVNSYYHLTGDRALHYQYERYGKDAINSFLNEMLKEYPLTKKITPMDQIKIKDKINILPQVADNNSRASGDTTNANNGNQFSSKRFFDNITPLAKGSEEPDDFLAMLDADED